MDNFQESQGPPPLRISLSTSSPTVSLSGSPPFYVTTTYEGTSTRPIWALIYLNRKRGRWAYEDKMGDGNISEGERKRILSEMNEVFWKDDAKMTFEAVE